MIDLEPFLEWRAAQGPESELRINRPEGDENGHAENGNIGAVGWKSGDGGAALRESCEQVAACLRETGALVIRDPRCSTADNDRFLDMMERYFGQTTALKRQQERPALHYQV